MGQINGQYVDDDDPGIGAFNWGSLIEQGFNFGNNFINQKYAKDTAKHTAAAQALAYQPAINSSSSVAATGTSGIGVGVDSQGISLGGGSHIGWGWVIGGIAIFGLLQSRGFQRRSR